ncbi:hypothetical protein I3760_06G016800 [Carya illinoinensis]|nr:hypothetical protein I3760_06G016800 [Carya illinoinensis]
MASVSLFVFFLVSYLGLLRSAGQQESYTQNCRPLRCGDLDRIGLPFINITDPICGGIVSCNKTTKTIQLVTGDERQYELTSIRSSHDQPNAYVLGIRDQKLSENLSSGKCKSITDSTIPKSPSEFVEIIQPKYWSLVKCDHAVDELGLQIKLNGIECTDNYFVYNNPDPRGGLSHRNGCSIIQLPIKPPPGDSELDPQNVTAEFELRVVVSGYCFLCHEKGVKCQIDINNCPNKGKSKVLPIVLATLSVAIGVLIVIGLSFRQKFRSILKKESLTHQNVEAFLRNNGPFGIRRYSYSDIKKMTNFLKDKLGQGGYGSVYKGKLQDGSMVAVKVLKGSIGNGEEFINEVASISRTSHVNIVTLRGFCFEGSKRALVYEFMPNGSLEKFIFKKDSPSNHQLQWETLYKIAIGTARGLEYLHRGCNNRILHFDIKPHNILLDENFCPKISDFGLAKVCPREQSIISMLGARGTAGYIAPEVFCRNFGGVSHKSDVYSYGMMVLEMVGGRKNIDAEVDHTSEIFFPHWIYRRLELDEELTLHGLKTEEDRQNAKKMTIVSLWCIQTDPSNRPAMSRVVEMLEMSLNALQIPPKPFLSSPSRLEADSSTIVILSHSGSKVP